MKMKRSHQNFVACVILHLLSPLTPLLLEFIYHRDITKESVVLAGAMYSFSIGITSNQIATFSICLFIGFVMSGSYGSYCTAAASKNTNPLSIPVYNFFHDPWAYMIIAIFAINLIERFDRHVNRGEIFFLFLRGE